MAIENERMLQEIGLRGPSDSLSYRVAVRSIERVADHAASIADKSLKITEKISNEVIQELDKMSTISLALLNDSVEAFLRRDYYLADSIVDKTEGIRSLENKIILFLDKEKTSFSTRHESTKDIRRTAEHASDIAEAAMNETVSEIIEKIQLVSQP